MNYQLSDEEKAFEAFAKRNSFYGEDKSVARRVWKAMRREVQAEGDAFRFQYERANAAHRKLSAIAGILERTDLSYMESVIEAKKELEKLAPLRMYG